MAATPGNRRTIVYILPDPSNVNEQAVPTNSLITTLMSNPLNYLVQAIKWDYIQYYTLVGGVLTNVRALAYEFFLTAVGDALFTPANLATLASQLNVATVPTWTEAITYGA